MVIIKIDSWHQFVTEIERLCTERESCAGNAISCVSELLYRGQSDSRMKLETTLERSVTNEVSLNNYYKFVSVIKAKIESATGKTWVIQSLEEFAAWLEKQDFPVIDIPGYAFLAYLRHHGLPSPFLDWSRSPYVAAYFAMTPEPKSGVQEVAIYVYLDSDSGFKVDDIDMPIVRRFGPYVTTHRRHYLQQSEYTICTKGKGRSLAFASHESVVGKNKGQDLLWKLLIPVSERLDFLRHLQLMNINGYSLFETEDKLMEGISLAEIVVGKRLSLKAVLPENF